jgi:hypothetical protein
VSSTTWSGALWALAFASESIATTVLV